MAVFIGTDDRHSPYDSAGCGGRGKARLGYDATKRPGRLEEGGDSSDGGDDKGGSNREDGGDAL